MKRRAIIIIICCILLMAGGVIWICVAHSVIGQQVEYITKIDSLEVEELPMIKKADRLYVDVNELCNLLNIEIERKDADQSLELTTTGEYVMISEEVAINIADAVIEQVANEKYLSISKCKVIEENGGQDYKVMRSIEGVYGSAYSVTISKKNGKVIDVRLYD